ncbi:MAG: DNA-3-methyladenine glycosylase 2 family protein, partial [Clostridia bacterium]|nr:DNA-3-methyladenine glycosylase 2 family protein [Clostridia bacterium]
SEQQLTAIGSGYRAPYIKKTAEMIAAGYDFEPLRTMDTPTARKELLQFPGVGPKVADCILLFSLGHTDAFPLDVWMKRAMRLMYFGGEEPCKKDMEQKIAQLGPNSGILQQYIFHYARENM